MIIFSCNWRHGEKYSEGIIHSLNNYVTAFIDSTMVVNMEGGPKAVDITADAPIVVKDAETFYKNPSYYHMRLFSFEKKERLQSSKRFLRILYCASLKICETQPSHDLTSPIDWRQFLQGSIFRC